MKKYNIIKNIFLYTILLTTSLVSSQKLKFEIENDSINKKLSLTSISDEVLKSIYEKGNTFETKFLGFDEGYYLLKKDENSVLLYLKPTDELKITFDNDNFYKSLTFSGEGSYVNSYLLNKRTEFLDRKGNLRKYYKKTFYDGSEDDYLNRLDKLYKENYGLLFGSQLSKKFKDDEMKNLQYGYSLDLLKYQDAKKYYKLKDSLAPSYDFLEPLNHIHFQNNQLFEKYNSYKELTVLKWKNDIENKPEYLLKNDVFSSIRIEALQEAVLESLYEDMNRNFPEKTRDYYNLIKRNTKNNKLLVKAKEKYAEIRHEEAEKNLSKFKFLDRDEVLQKLVNFKGKFIFLNIWTTWCLPCIKDFRRIEKLQDKFENDNIVFVSISVDKEQEYPLWLNMLKEHGLKGDHLFLDDSKSKFIKAYNIKAIPSFVLISPKGIPLEIDIQNLDAKKTEKDIERLLKQENGK